MIVFVGSNPSTSSPTLDPFDVGTKSRRTVDNWLTGISVDKRFANVCDFTTPNNRPLTKKQIKEALHELVNVKLKDADKIVAVGKVAATALRMANISFLEMPHPSGRCRIWNDLTKTTQILIELRDYVQR